MNNNSCDEYEIDLLKLCKTYWNHALLIVLVGLLVAGGFFVKTYLGGRELRSNPVYSATASIFINKVYPISDSMADTYISSSVFNSAEALNGACVSILKSPDTLEEVIAQAELPYSVGNLSGLINAQIDTKNFVFELTATGKSPEETERIANTTAEVMQQRIPKIVDNSDVRIISLGHATALTGPSKRDYAKKAAIGFAIGVVLAGIVITVLFVLRESRDENIHASDELQQLFPNVRLLSMIPEMRPSKKDDKLLCFGQRRKKDADDIDRIGDALGFSSREAFKRLRTNLALTLSPQAGKGRLIGLTSVQPGDGGSAAAFNLALAFAESGKRTLLLDADMRIPSIHRKAGFAQSPGLSELLANPQADPGTAIKACQNSGVSFDVIPAGAVPQNPSELLNSARMAEIMQALADRYDYVVVSLPPVSAVVDAVSAAAALDGMLVLIRENNCPRSLLSACMEQLDYAGVNVLGFIINGKLEGAPGEALFGNYNYS